MLLFAAAPTLTMTVSIGMALLPEFVQRSSPNLVSAKAGRPPPNWVCHRLLGPVSLGARVSLALSNPPGSPDRVARLARVRRWSGRSSRAGWPRKAAGVVRMEQHARTGDGGAHWRNDAIHARCLHAHRTGDRARSARHRELCGRPEWLRQDLVAGLVLTALLVPQGMAYAELAGLPPITGLYTTILCLIGYAVFGPSRVLVLGPDSALGPMIAATLIPLTAANGDPNRAVAYASLLALMVGAITVLAGVLKLGFVAELLSKPTQIGYMNGLALTIVVGSCQSSSASRSTPIT